MGGNWLDKTEEKLWKKIREYLSEESCVFFFFFFSLQYNSNGLENLCQAALKLFWCLVVDTFYAY